MRVVNVEAKLAQVREHWKPHVVGSVNESHVKVVKLAGEFVWHRHDNEDEMFFVMRGTLRMRIREAGVETEEVIAPGEFIIIPRGTDHLPVADDEVHVLLFEPQTTVNTGNAGGPRTLTDLPRI